MVRMQTTGLRPRFLGISPWRAEYHGACGEYYGYHGGCFMVIPESEWPGINCINVLRFLITIIFAIILISLEIFRQIFVFYSQMSSPDFLLGNSIPRLRHTKATDHHYTRKTKVSHRQGYCRKHCRELPRLHVRKVTQSPLTNGAASITSNDRRLSMDIGWIDASENKMIMCRVDKLLEQLAAISGQLRHLKDKYGYQFGIKEEGSLETKASNSTQPPSSPSLSSSKIVPPISKNILADLPNKPPNFFVKPSRSQQIDYKTKTMNDSKFPITPTSTTIHNQKES